MHKIFKLQKDEEKLSFLDCTSTIVMADNEDDAITEANRVDPTEITFTRENCTIEEINLNSDCSKQFLLVNYKIR